MSRPLGKAFIENFLGHSPDWYKATIIVFLVINPFVAIFLGKFIAGWLLIGQFIFTLAMALKCYPLPAGGLLAIQAVLIGLTTGAVLLILVITTTEIPKWWYGAFTIFPTLLVGPLASRCFPPPSAQSLAATVWSRPTP